MDKRRFITPDEIPSGVISIRVDVPNDTYCIAAFLAALSDLEEVEKWQSVGGVTPEEIAAVWQEIMAVLVTLPTC